MRCAIGIFAKTIGLSQVKTRLATSLGKDKAEAFYALSVASIEALMKEAKAKFNVEPYWVLAEEQAPALEQWSSFPAIWTGEGNLGNRLANVSEHLSQEHDAVFLIGTDSPQLSLDAIEQSLKLLEKHPEDCVCGPALDGGFYLFASREAILREIWESVTYSADTTLAELIGKSERAFHHLDPQQDVDVVEDLMSLRDGLKKRDDLLPEQVELLRWLDGNSFLSY